MGTDWRSGAQESDLDCRQCREVVSARLDGEDPPGGAAGAERAEAHLATCSACRAFVDDAAHITRLARTRPVEEVVDLTPALLEAWTDAAPVRERAAAERRRHARRRRWAMDVVRAGLGLVALGQLSLAGASIVATRSDEIHVAMPGMGLSGASAAHFSHESAAWNLALGVAFGWVALGRFRPSAGLVPMIAAFVGVLTALSVPDLVAGRVDPSRLVGHGVVVIGLVLLLVFRALHRDDGGRATGAGGEAGRAPGHLFGSLIPVRGPDGRSGQGLEPTGRRAA
ncbi:zf-HC2 domain-containing protein [Pseudonocardia alaniniphila]|uniref:Zf-HC2 domain-containing protein n=1 Tax=Pseudonocardia alaniniphila TaxID=75291 RepID=A0ABS9TB80_9PSEU|nr:zf-HC2 domain-containing protein [Pseudonocardia alaniniphila]MCH6165784.1 zf-HC2 domain-containing protein [Pseudonocardia alaniniphila]